MLWATWFSVCIAVAVVDVLGGDLTRPDDFSRFHVEREDGVAVGREWLGVIIACAYIKKIVRGI